MEKKQAEKIKRLTRGAAAVLAAIGIMGGCVKQTDMMIVSEKTEGLQETSEQPGEETGDETQKVPGQGSAIRELAEIPEIYRTDIREENITIRADVKVEVPEIDRIPQMEIQYLPYTDEELERMKEILGEELGITQWVESSQGSPQEYDSPDHVYNLSLRAGSSREIPIVWLSCPGVSDGLSGDDNQDSLSGCSMTEEDRERIQADMERKAEELLEKVGLEDFYLTDVRWRPLAVSRNYSWMPSGQWGIRLYYQRRIGDMAVISSRGGEAFLDFPLQYVELLYKEDGTLLAVKDIGRDKVTGISGYTEFLLPFLSVSRVFEQCMKTTEIFEPDEKSHICLTVTEVKLAYQTEYENQDIEAFQTGSGRGKLVPVWAFYGIREQSGQSRDEMEMRQSLSGRGKKILLLVVNAEDGTIYER